MHVLVVDDDAPSLHLIATMVESAGHTVSRAVDGKEALEAAHACPPDIIISDILMPRMDGYQLAREWKSDDVLSAIPLVFLTASYTDPADERFARELGADGFLSKPVEQDVLIETIGTLGRTAGLSAVREPVAQTELEVVQAYSERLVHKLEDKLEEIGRTNALLEQTMAALSAELEAKESLIGALHEQMQVREQKEDDLSRERDLTRSIIDTADVFIMGTDVTGRIMLFSPGAERISGYSAEDLDGQDYVEALAPPAEKKRRRELHEALLERGSTHGLTSNWVMRSGEERILEWSTTVLRAADGSAAGLMWFGVDATERIVSLATDRAMGVVDLAVLIDRPVEHVLELTCAQTADEFSLAGVWIALFDEGEGHGSIAAAAGPATPALVSLFEKDPDAACLVSDPSDLSRGSISLDPEDGSLPEAWEELLRADDLQAVLLAPIRVRSEAVGVLGALSHAARGFESGRDRGIQLIADRIGVAMTYAEARERLNLQSAALESAANAIGITDIEGRLLWVNGAYETLTGWTAEELVGSVLSDGTAGYREPQYAQAWKHVARGVPWSSEVHNASRDGTEYVEVVTIAPVSGPDGAVTHAVVVKQDVSERARLEQLKSDFVAMVSHELRTPLTTIIGYGDLLGASIGSLSEEKVAAATGSIRESSRRMQDIVEQLLEVVQIQAQGVVVQAVARDVGAMVRRVAEGYPLDDRHRLSVSVAEALPALMVDESRLSRALRNIIDNAQKYSPEGGDINVSVTDAGSDVVIAVSDEGVGIPEQNVPVLFEAFHQRDMSSTRSYGGVGLGLFVALQFVEAHGGRIGVRSREGHGSTFEIRLPVPGAPTEPV